MRKLKYRIVQSFVAVGCAVCVSYAGMRTTIGMLLERGEEAVETASLVSTVDDATSAEAGKTTEVQLVWNPSATGTGSATSSSAQEPATTTETPEQQDPPSDDVATRREVAQETSTASEDSPLDEDEREDEGVGEQAPSLDEYLNQFICGACRRCCSLANPRCNNGARTAEIKIQEYYATYPSAQ